VADEVGGLVDDEQVGVFMNDGEEFLQARKSATAASQCRGFFTGSLPALAVITNLQTCLAGAGLIKFPGMSRPNSWKFSIPRLAGRKVIPGLLLVLAVLLAYWPAWHGGFVWDDGAWTTTLLPLFQNAGGLKLIWFQPTVLQQYYPLSATTFWLDYQFWNLWTLPYHIENILCHAAAALLFWRMLLQLRLPGAWLAAALFALHPVMVESTAWITERKNVLSLVFFLAALLAYGRYSPWTSPVPAGTAAPRLRCATWYYVLAFVLFLFALLAKTSVFCLPAVILLLVWWRRGELRWRANVLPTLPFFALALVLCGITAWMEKNHVGAVGPDFALSFPQRCLIAGHAFWFYIGNLFWPENLCFVYPRWQVNPGTWWQWVYPLTAIGTLPALWLARKRIGRGPLTAALFYGGSLFPVLGFMNAYGMRFSFVWDHWVYLSSLGIITLAAALVVQAAERLRRPAMAQAFAILVLPLLACLTWRQAGTFKDMETLWRTTLAKNPDCGLAHTDLGLLLDKNGQVDEAIVHFRRAAQINPDYPWNFYYLGRGLAHAKRFDEAITNFKQAIQIDPGDDYTSTIIATAIGATHFNLGAIYDEMGRTPDAVAQYQEALRLNPALPEALNNLAWILAANADEKLRNGAKSVALARHACDLTRNTEPYYLGTLAAAYAEAGHFPDAVATAQKAEQLARSAGLVSVADKNHELLELYQAGKPFHEPRRP
jgi:tetratricopeptide (TPR) repeat protein